MIKQVHMEKSDLSISAGSIFMLHRAARPFPARRGDIPSSPVIGPYTHLVVNTSGSRPAHLFQNGPVMAVWWRA